MSDATLDRRTRSAFSDPENASETFFYDQDNAGIVSSQQLRVDWSKFENHVFFGSATANVNVAFDKIVNQYPYDGTREQTNSFLSSLTGFERWFLSRLPTWTGHVNLSSSHIATEDRSGGAFSGNAETAEQGTAVLSPGTGSLSVEMRLNPAVTASQIVAACSGSTDRWTVYVTSSTHPASCSVGFAVSTQTANMLVTTPIQLGEFSSVCCVYDASDALAKLRLIVNGRVKAESSGSVKSQLETSGSWLLIGSGSAFVAGRDIVTPSRTLSGSIDEFRVWKRPRSAEAVRADMQRALHAQSELALYYKFNEPPPPLVSGSSSAADAVVLDSSGNALHGFVANFLSACRATSSLDGGTLVGERASSAPVLFPEYPSSVQMRREFIASASLFDAANPNNILRLVPKHFLEEARVYDGVSDAGTIHGETYRSAGGLPGTGVLGSTQLLVSVLYTMARFFDELKLGVDAMSAVDDADFDEPDTVPDAFLNEALARRGFTDVPALFSDATVPQYVDGVAMSDAASTPGKVVRNALLRRFLSCAPDIISSKGTIHSVRAALMSLGVDPDTSVKLKESAEIGAGSLRDAARDSSAVIGMFSASGSFFATSAFLSGSRFETGWPHAAGTMVSKTLYPPHGVSSAPSDGLYTSGSWSLGFAACWPSGSLLLTQSLLRLMTTGSLGRSCLANVVITKNDDQTGDVTLYANNSQTGRVTELSIRNMCLFDGALVRFDVSYEREDRATAASLSSSYALSVFSDGLSAVTQSYAPAIMSGDAYRVITSSFNASGAYVEIGDRSLPTNIGFISTSSAPEAARAVAPCALLGQVQFWSKSSTESEVEARGRNFASFAADNPFINASGAPTSATGSFERIRMDVARMLSVAERVSDASGSIIMRDATHYDTHLYVSGVAPSTDCGQPIVVRMSRLGTSFDESVSSERVRIGALNAFTTETLSAARQAQFSAELSLVDALSKTMLDMMSSSDPIADAVGTAAASMAPDYPDLVRLSDVFFERLTSKLDFAAYFSAYRWLESLMGTLIQQLIPRHAAFGGTSFVVEPHALERGKVEYRGADRYLSVAPIAIRRDSIYLNQIVGQVMKI